jgi:hypothetical protein
MTQIYRPRYKYEQPKLVFKGAKATTFTKEVDSFLILPNAKKAGFKIQFRCKNRDGRYSFFFLHSFHDLDGVNRKMQREALSEFLKEDKKQFADIVSKHALINKRETFFKDIKEITVYKKGKDVGYFGPRKDNCHLPHYVTQVHFMDGTSYKTFYKF